MKRFKGKDLYKPLIIPINKPFEKLSKKEANNYFEWFVAHIDERADYIREIISLDLDISIDVLDFSLPSLVYIWRWFLNVVEIDKTPRSTLKAIRKELKSNGESKEFISDMLRENEQELSIFSRYIIRDIAMYVGKMFVSNFPVLRWDYHTDTAKDSFANIPQIFGFIDDAYSPPFEEQFDPIHYVEMVASNIFDNTQTETDLYDMYIRWMKWIPNKN